MTTTPNEITIPATDSQALAIWRSIGPREALHLLEGLQRHHPGAPGLGLACAAVGRQEAEHRGQIAAYALRAAAKAGHDISAIPSIFTALDSDGWPCFWFEAPAAAAPDLFEPGPAQL